jgi:hypothetical protein
VRPVAIPADTAFARDNEIAQSGAKSLPKQRVCVAMAIERGGIEEVDASIGGCPHRSDRIVVADVVTPPKTTGRPAAVTDDRDIDVSAG